MKRKICFFSYVLLVMSCAMMFLTLGCADGPKRKDDKGKNEKPVDTTKPIVNVYLENSGSMDGYVTLQGSDFKSAIYDYLSNIEMTVTDSKIKELNLFYINDSVIPMEKDLEAFIKELNPVTFKKMGGRRGSTQMSDLMKKVLPKTDTECSVLISDLILSPGKKQDASKFVSLEQNGIKMKVYDAMQTNPNLSVMVYRLLSNFKGTYYDKMDNAITLNDTRPYFIMVVGSANNIRKIMKASPEEKIKGGGVENVWYFTRCGQKVEYAVAKNSGEFSVDKKDAKHTIVDLKRNKKGKVSFTVNVDFSTLLVDDDYLLDVANYEMCNSKYRIVGVDESTDGRYTHKIKVESKTGKPVKGDVVIKLKSRFPSDIESYNDNDGSLSHIRQSLDKTYGITNILTGIYDAFTYGGDDYCEIKIKIK